MAIWNERIKQKRLAKGITLAQIADALNVTEATAQRYESGNIKNVPYEHMCTYAKLLGCSPQYLMGWTKDDSENLLDYFDKILDEIITSLEKSGYTVLNTDSNNDDTIIIKNRVGKVIKTTNSGELVNQYERLRMNNMPQTVISLIENEMATISNRTTLYIQLFESYGYEINVYSDNAYITNTDGDLYTLSRKDFMSLIQRCHKDITYNLERFINEHNVKTKPVLNAAHERTDIEVTEVMRKHDDNIMLDDSEWE